MAPKSNHKHQGPGQARGRRSRQRESTIPNSRMEDIEKAKIITELVAGAFSIPFTATYDSQLEISDFEDMLETAAETSPQPTERDKIHNNNENNTKILFMNIERPWHHQSHVQQRHSSAQNQLPLASWENQAPDEEPFHDIGAVCSTSLVDNNVGEFMGSSDAAKGSSEQLRFNGGLVFGGKEDGSKEGDSHCGM